jgi:peptidoglycan/xylan/chitin deacetylase (PgdA/CDA1 family)
MRRKPKTAENRRRARVERLKLAALAVAGLCTVSIPVTIALVLSATGASDVLTLGGASAENARSTPAQAVAELRCEPALGYYALTVDGGPYPATTRRLVGALKRARAVATFFDVGRRAAHRQDLVDLQRSVGHVASHAYSGVPLPGMSSQRRIDELRTTARVLGYPNVFVRPPGGATSPEVDADIRRTGLTPVYWTVDAADPAFDAAAIARRALSVAPGGIVRLRDGADATIEAIPAIVEGLRERGLCPGFLVRTSELATSANGVRFPVQAVKP